MMRDRVFASTDKSDLFEKLSKTKQKNDEWLFENNKDIFLFAVALGWKHKKRIPLKKRQTEIPLAVFQKSRDNIHYIDLIALAENKDVYILNWDDEKKVEEKLQIVEEYANGGLEILRNKLFSSSGHLYDNLLLLVKETCGEKQVIDDLTDIDELVGML
jgi:dnd system-associated protein 4